MSVVYVRFEVSLHGMKLVSEQEIEELRLTLDRVVRERVHPAGPLNIMESDVEVEISEHAGKPE